jgi:hypothetical protein
MATHLYVLCMAYSVKGFLKASLQVTFVIDLCSHIRRRMGNYRHLSPIKQEKYVNVSNYVYVLFTFIMSSAAKFTLCDQDQLLPSSRWL